MEGVELRVCGMRRGRGVDRRRSALLAVDRPSNGVERQVVPEHALGGVDVTCGVWAARCAYDFVKPRSRRDAGTARLIRGGVTNSSAVFCSRGCCVCFIFLTVGSEGASGVEVGARKCWAWWREVSIV